MSSCKGYSLEPQKFMILGEGSNILFPGDYDGIILHPLIRGVEIDPGR